MAYEYSERNILRSIKNFVNPPPKPIVDGNCPKYSFGNGYNAWSAYRREDYTGLWRIGTRYVEEMFNEAYSRIPINGVDGQGLHARKVIDVPTGDEWGSQDDFEVVKLRVQGVNVLFAVKRREDNWWDVCLTIATVWKNTERPDIS